MAIAQAQFTSQSKKDKHKEKRKNNLVPRAFPLKVGKALGTRLAKNGLDKKHFYEKKDTRR